jgi:hypothetical protein
MTMQWMVNVNVKEYVKAHLSPCLIEKNTINVDGQVDEQQFVFCLVARDRRVDRFVARALKYKGNRCAPLNREAVGSQSLWRTEKSHILCQIRRKYYLFQAMAQRLKLIVVKLCQ